jgi:2,3-bisphosphoglycerate-dependent phosphoglycerate mutase
MATFVLVHHGQSIYNLENRFTGNLYWPDAIGVYEAKQIGKKLIDYHLDIAYSSMIRRAQCMFKIIPKIIGLTRLRLKKMLLRTKGYMAK